MNNKKKIGVVGFGLRAEYMVKNFALFDMPAQVVAIVDPQREKVLSRLETLNISPDSVTFYENITEMMAKEVLSGVMVASSCETHGAIAAALMPYDLPLFLEKPVVISQGQWDDLYQAQEKYQPHVLVSFPLRVTPLVEKAKEVLDRGVLGKISQVQMVNNVSYARVYYRSWFRDDNKTGGLFMQKATHDLDLLQYLLEDVPTVVSAMESKVIFTGEKPANLTCPQCEEYYSCPESSHAIKHQYHEGVEGEGCVFATDTGNHDSATILLGFDNGVHGVYTQNFVARKAAAQRSMRIIGYEGTLEFDFVTATIRVFHHLSGCVETIHVDSFGLNHFGGDKVLAENFVAMLAGTEKTRADLWAGLNSAKTCLMAKKSAEEQVFIRRNDP